MAIANVIPQVWSTRLQENMKKFMVFGSLCNRNYEGDIAHWGDTVSINTRNDITVKAYNPANEIDDPEQLSGTDTTLVIDHGAYYNFFINDADAAQARTDLIDAAMRNAAYRLATDAESYILDVIRSGAGTKTEHPMPAINSIELYELLLDIKTAFDQKGVPIHDRKLIIPPALGAMLLANIRLVIGMDATANRIAEGSVARALGFDIYTSLDLNDELVAMIPDAVTFANQITKLEAYRPEKGFADGMQGLCLSGAKVVFPSAVYFCHLMTSPQ